MFDGMPYQPPRRMFYRCRHCKAVVLKTKHGLVTPALGYPHVCEKEESHEREPAGQLVAAASGV